MTSSSKAVALCALVILLTIGGLSFHSTLHDAEDREWVTHTHLVIEQRDEILIDITQAETGQRGYLLTGNDKYMVPYEFSLRRVYRDIEEFRRLTSDNSRQQAAADQLQLLIDARLSGLRERIDIRRQNGLDAAVAAVTTGDDGEELMNRIRNLISAMGNEEQQLLRRRLQVAAQGAARVKAIIVIGNALAIFFLAVAGIVIHRESVKRGLAERSLRTVNERLERRTVELSETNSELESFSYSVAHDLRAPLRQIGGYSKILIQDYAESLDSEARRYLDKVEDGARKMGRLVDDLLSLSRIGRQELLLQPTSLNSVLQQVLGDLESECSGREIEWQIGGLFSLECDPNLMKQVFMNLLSNAVKYTRTREHAVIQVGQMRHNDRPVVFVRDNGVGFEMQYVGKLFGVFQRLHKARDFEGTGVGLAIVQRIIRKHGGTIWAEAELDRGATFFFTLASSENKMGGEPIKAIESGVIHVA